MVRIVMKKVKLLDACPRGQAHGIFHAAVAPSHMLPVFLAVVLRIQDEKIDTANELDQFLIFRKRELSTSTFAPEAFGVGRAAGDRLFPRGVRAMKRLVVRKVCQGTSFRFQSIPDTDTWVIRKGCANFDFADIELHVLELGNNDVAGQLLQRYGEIRALHLVREYPRQTSPSSFVAQHTNAILWIVGRQEERKPLDVVPMRVGD